MKFTILVDPSLLIIIVIVCLIYLQGYTSICPLFLIYALGVMQYMLCILLRCYKLNMVRIGSAIFEKRTTYATSIAMIHLSCRTVAFRSGRSPIPFSRPESCSTISMGNLSNSGGLQSEVVQVCLKLAK